jgi:hypothetical protein
MTDPATSPRLISLLLQQIIEEKVASTEKLAAQIAASTESISLKVRAYHAAAAVSADGPALLAEAIEKNDHTILQTQLLKILAELGEARGPLETLSRRDDAVGLLARFELARPTGGDDAAEAAGQAVEAGHAVVLDYLLDRARRDIAQRRDASAFYTQALIAILHSVQADSPVMLPEHTQAAQAAELLGELATPQAVQTITAILTGHYNALSRTVAGGLLRCKNKTACEWLAPLLTSPYEELSSDAALTLGQHGDHRAAPALQDIVNHSHHHRPELTALAGWYLAKLSGQAAPTVSALCEAFK